MGSMRHGRPGQPLFLASAQIIIISARVREVGRCLIKGGISSTRRTPPSCLYATQGLPHSTAYIRTATPHRTIGHPGARIFFPGGAKSSFMTNITLESAR